MIFNKGKIFRFFRKPELCQEAFDAYFDRLPDSLQVSWFKDGKYIIGEVEADGEKFMTQAVSAKEFVEMVNDALFVTYKIPEKYFDVLLASKKFMPTKDQFEAMDNIAITKSNIEFKKSLVTA